MRRFLLFFSIPCIFLSCGIYILYGSTKATSENNQKWHGVVQPTIQSFFSPDDDIQKHLIYYIDNEPVALSIASFRFTNKNISSAVMRAFDRGIRIELTADRGCFGVVQSKVLLLSQYGVPVYTFPPLKNDCQVDFPRVSEAALMHNKFIIFHGQQAVWTGSYNFTQAAQTMHQENAVMIWDYATVERYKQQFEIIKQRSTLIKRSLKY